MIDIETALRLILENVEALPVTSRNATEALGYVLAQAVRAAEHAPPFDASAMDGFAVHVCDTAAASPDAPVELPVTGTVRAGGAAPGRLEFGEARKIMTGAPVPEGADAVVMKENVTIDGGSIIVTHPLEKGENLRLRGGEFSPGETVVSAGTTISPGVVGVLCSLGCLEISVFRKPRVALIVTGDEVRAPHAALAPGEIRDSISASLVAALRALWIEPCLVSRVGDEREALGAILEGALNDADVVITSGGVSVGEFDLVKEVAEERGVTTIFWRIAMKPGKPNFFGRRGRRLFFGLPGNPVSALVSYHQLVKPALLAMSGRERTGCMRFKARLESDLRKRTPRLEFVRGVSRRDPGGNWIVSPLRGQESHMIGSLARADCLIHFPKEVHLLERGSEVDIEPLLWSE